MNLPPFLKPGDTIGICAPARKVSPEETSDGIAMIKSHGYNVLEAPNLYGASHQFSGTDEQRRSDLQFMLDNPEVKAFISARGGYGCVRIFDGIDWTEFRKNPKWLIGFSDLTVFHNHIFSMGMASIHGPMLFNLSKEKLYPPAASHLFDVLSGKLDAYQLKPNPRLQSLNRKGVATGRLTGGNLSILYSQAGSPSDLNTENSILFLEDLDEYLYHIDRMMMQLKRSGKLDGIKGLIVGGMNDMKDNAVPFGETAEQIIRRICEPYDFPLWFGFPAGHIPENHPLIFGAEVKMDVSEELRLEYVQTA